MNRKLILTVVSIFYFCLHANAGEGEYAVDKIPAELLKVSNAVVRYDEQIFELIDSYRARVYKKVVITVLNEKGDDYAIMVEGYGDFEEIKSFDGKLYNAEGKKVRTLKSSEVHDVSSEGDELISKNRVRFHTFSCKDYPYTVEYEIESQQKETMFFPSWRPQSSTDRAVQFSSFTIITPNDYKFRYKAFNYPGQPVVAQKGKTTSTTWHIENALPIKSEFASPDWRELSIGVVTGPTAFEIEHYQGNMTDWQNFAKFSYFLKKDRDALPANVKKEVHDLVDTVKDFRNKVSVLYAYMQRNTRYISIQLGIGGWQPLDANFVATKKYGDCKALSNFMYALLKEAGIESKYTLIVRTREPRDIITDFPSQQFNHVILCVPHQKDTIWLECTSQTLPAGYLDWSTTNRHALVVDENGGQLVMTPKYGLENNIKLSKLKGIVDEEGNFTMETQIQYKAQQHDQWEMLTSDLPRDKLLDYFRNHTHLSSFDINKFEFVEDKLTIPSIYLNIALFVNGYAQASGKRLFIKVNVLNRFSTRLDSTEERKNDIVLNDELRDIDSVEIKVPPGFTAESLPRDIKIETMFGKYISSVKFGSDKIIYYRLQEQYSGKFPAKNYGELVKFYNQIYLADQAEVVLVKRN